MILTIAYIALVLYGLYFWLASQVEEPKKARKQPRDRKGRFSKQVHNRKSHLVKVRDMYGVISYIKI